MQRRHASGRERASAVTRPLDWRGLVRGGEGEVAGARRGRDGVRAGGGGRRGEASRHNEGDAEPLDRACARVSTAPEQTAARGEERAGGGLGGGAHLRSDYVPSPKSDDADRPQPVSHFSHHTSCADYRVPHSSTTLTASWSLAHALPPLPVRSLWPPSSGLSPPRCAYTVARTRPRMRPSSSAPPPQK